MADPLNLIRWLGCSLFMSFAATALAQHRIAIEGFTLGQQMRECQKPSRPAPKVIDSKELACEYPANSQKVFGLPAALRSHLHFVHR